MLKLPNAERAIVPIEKLRDYCLNPSHDTGKHKAIVFRAALGLTVADAERLRDMIFDAIISNEATEIEPSEHGRRFIVEFELIGLRGKAIVRTAWIVRRTEDFPRLTSCYIP